MKKCDCLRCRKRFSRCPKSGEILSEGYCLSGPLGSVVSCSRCGVMPSVEGRVCSVGGDEQRRAVEQHYLRTGGNVAWGDQLVA